MNMYRILFFFAFAFLCEGFAAQNNVLDSLRNELKIVENDSVRCNIYIEMGDYFDYTILDSAMYYYNKCTDLAKSKGLTYPLSSSLGNTGIVHHVQGNFDLAYEYYLKALAINEKIDNKSGMAINHNNIGIIYRNLSNYFEAINSYQKSLALYTELEDESGVARSYSNIAIVYHDQANYDNSIKYMFKALRVHEETGNLDGVAICYNNIGSVYHKQDNYQLAIEYYLEALIIREEAGDIRNMSVIYNNIGNVYFDTEEYNKALEYHNRSLKLKQKLSDRMGISSSYTNIGNVHLKKGDYEQALSFYHKALKIDNEIGDKRGQAVVLHNIAKMHLEIADTAPDSDIAENLEAALYHGLKSYNVSLEIGALHAKNNAAKILKEAYTKTGNYKKAIQYANIYISTNREIFNEERAQALADMQTKYETEKKQLEIDNLNKQNELRQVELAISEEQRQKQLVIINVFIFGFIIIAIFSFIIFRLFIQKRKANILLADQKEQIQLQNHELKQANEEIMAQRDEIETQHDMVMNQKEKIEIQKTKIDDSIRYAKRIQEAVVPSREQLTEMLGNHFVIFRPKDVVSGDFYWATKVKNWLIITAADCTGHGVPGAFMSMLGISFLNEIVRKKEILNPASILENLRDEVIYALGQDVNHDAQMDGMDMSLVAINQQTGKCLFAGAGNPLWVIRKEYVDKSFEDPIDMIQVIKGDSMPVAKSVKMKNFTEHEVQLYKGDTIYLFSDGIPDQFGGPKGRKFMVKQLKRLIAQNVKLDLNEQKLCIENTVDEWMNHSGHQANEQIDDMTMLCWVYN